VCFCGCGGWRVGVREIDGWNRNFIVANGEKLAKFPLARGNNSTTIVSVMVIICIDAPDRALSEDGDMIIDLPEFCTF
jgi:hypothetical protein